MEDLSVETGESWQALELPYAGTRELLISAEHVGPEAIGPAVEWLKQAHGAQVVAAQYFGPQLTADGTQRAQALIAEWPLTWVVGADGASQLSGMHLRAVTNAAVQPLELDGRPVGYALTGPHAIEVRLDGLRAPDLSASPEAQATATFEQMEAALGLVGMDFSHVARTWLYLDDILGWYGEFNRARTAFFTSRGVFDGLVPASTGIGGANPEGAALVARVYAVKPLSPEVSVVAIPSPLQCPALKYGSSFSRAVEVRLPGLRRVLVSGTASIAPEGHTEHVGDLEGQIKLTCEVIAAILESREMSWADVTRATAYVRAAEYAEAWERYRAAGELSELPVVTAHNVICRGDLLFEMEVDAEAAG